MALICLYKLYKNGGHEWLQGSSKRRSELLWYKAAFFASKENDVATKRTGMLIRVKETSFQLCPTASSNQTHHTGT